MLDGTQTGVAGALALFAELVLGRSFQKMQIVFQDVLDPQKNIAEAGLAIRGPSVSPCMAMADVMACTYRRCHLNRHR